MRTLPLVLLAVAALLGPTAALAAGPSTPVSRMFVITGLVLGDQKADVSGKLGIDGDQLNASVGCNTIGGKVGVDGDTVTIGDSLLMTQMACPGTSGQLEDMFIKVLQHGPFRITADAWIGDGATIVVLELTSPNPGPNASAPDEPVGSSPGAVITDPFQSCPPLPSGLNGATPIDVGPGSVGGGSGSTGSGSSGGDSAPGTSEPDAGSGGSSMGASGTGSAPSATAIAEPGASAIAVPPVPPDAGQTPDLGQKQPEPSFPIEPGQTVVTDPGVLDPCVERLYAVDPGNGTGAVAPKPVDAAEHAGLVGSNMAALALPIGAALVALALVAVVAVRRWRGTRLGGTQGATVVTEPADPTATPR